jgi:hypothetical protein
MKTLVTFLILSALCPVVISQNNTQAPLQVSDRISHSLGDLSFSGAPVVLFNTPNGTQFAGGFKMRIFMGRRFSFDADIVFSRDYLHTGAGIIGIPLWMLTLGSSVSDEESTFSEFLLKIAAMALSAEHFAYHAPVAKDFELSPYISVLRYKYANRYANYSDTTFISDQLNFAAGIELNKYYKHFLLSPYIEFNIGYKDHIPGVNVGIYCGVFIPNKRLR